jgi:hypothetical protein
MALQIWARDFRGRQSARILVVKTHDGSATAAAQNYFALKASVSPPRLVSSLDASQPAVSLTPAPPLSS